MAPWFEVFAVGQRNCREQAISLRTGLLVKSRYYANHYDESLFPLEIVGDYFLAEEEQCKSANLEKAIWKSLLSDSAAWE